MSNNSPSHIVRYKTYFYVLLGLLTFTTLSVLITQIQLGKLAIVGALIFASLKASLVLWFFMHLKYENRILRTMVGLVLFIFVAVLIVTFFDYSFH